jgi:phosphoglucomutase
MQQVNAEQESHMYSIEKARKIAQKWTTAPFDELTRHEVQALLDAQQQDDALLDRFGREMEFGTAGLRGIMGSGIYYMNPYTVQRAAKGLADCLCTRYPESIQRGVVIGFDCRHRSDEFARITAEVIAATGIKVYLYSQLGPTPLVPFAVRRLNAKAGVMITSSHNPKQYNGFKVFWENGAQIISPLDKEISDCINDAPDYDQIESIPLDRAVADGRITLLVEKDIERYTDWAAQTASLRGMHDVRVLYTPLHGTGYHCMEQAFCKAGFTDFNVVTEQRDPNGDFPTVSAPNPEKEDALDLARKEAEKINADIIVASDGDTDRIGIAVRDRTGEYITLTGNQIGTVLMYYIFAWRKETNRLTGNEFGVASVVSSPLAEKICRCFGADFCQTLTGFKWMGNVTEDRVQQGRDFILAYEEAFGVTFGESRDKDAVISIVLACEAAAFCKKQGRNLLDLIDEMYVHCDLHLEAAAERFYEGAQGAEQMNTIMKSIRENPPSQINGCPVKILSDVLTGTRFEKGVPSGTVSLPSQNLLYFILEDDSWLAIRPSGTEPKIKAYLGVIQSTTPDSLAADKQEQTKKLAALRQAAVQLLAPAG